MRADKKLDLSFWLRDINPVLNHCYSMIKTLILMRHAEAAALPGARDFDRTLTSHGVAMAAAAARHLEAMDSVPQKILCSPALRTRQTSQLLLENWKAKPEVHFEDGLYGASPDAVMELIRWHDDEDRLMIVGHNPWVHMLAITLGGVADIRKHPEMKTMYPPASCTVLRFDVADWRGMEKGKGEVIDFYYPSGIAHG